MEKISAFAKACCLCLIRVYQLCISPYLGPHCRFTPTCSQYAIQAIEQHGIFRGFYLSCRRIMKCHPWHAGGVDPVPINKKDLDPNN